MSNVFPTPFDFSQSSLQDYADCPRRFQLRYLQKMVWPGVEADPTSEQELHQREGVQFHRMVHQYMLGVPPARVAVSAGSPQLEHWWKNFLSADLSLAGEVRRSELTMFCQAGAHRLVGKYDLISVQDGRATIYDWKTSMRRPKRRVARFQVANPGLSRTSSSGRVGAAWRRAIPARRSQDGVLVCRISTGARGLQLRHADLSRRLGRHPEPDLRDQCAGRNSR